MTQPEWALNIMVTVPKTLGTDARIDHVRAELDDDHVHMVLVVDREGRLVTTIERADLTPDLDGSALASAYGRLAGRTVTSMTPTTTIAQLLDSTGRRLAVVDERRFLRGLVCLKQSRDGYCGDDDVRARANESDGKVPPRLRQD